jgi:predicted CXXCH cytochrome family protein
MKRYERTLVKRGTALAPVLKGVCQGCHMAVPPQLNNILARMDSVEICPRCHRILYRPDALNPDAEA